LVLLTMEPLPPGYAADAILNSLKV
jgi:hypothetical protein